MPRGVEWERDGRWERDYSSGSGPSGDGRGSGLLERGLSVGVGRSVGAGLSSRAERGSTPRFDLGPARSLAPLGDCPPRSGPPTRWDASSGSGSHKHRSRMIKHRYEDAHNDSHAGLRSPAPSRPLRSKLPRLYAHDLPHRAPPPTASPAASPASTPTTRQAPGLPSTPTPWPTPSAPASAARSGSTPAAGRCTPPTARTTGRCRSASSSRATIDDVVATVAAARRHRRAGPVPRRRHQPRRAVLQRRGRDGLLQVPAPRPRASTRSGKLGTVAAGLRARRPARRAPQQHGLTFGPDPSTHNHCTLGGMLGNDSCGVHSLLGPSTAAACAPPTTPHELEILTYDGLRHARRRDAAGRAGARSSAAAAGAARSTRSSRRCATGTPTRSARGFPKLPRRVSGYNLDELLPENGFHVARALVGTESTCVTILEATLNLVPEPEGALAAGPRLPGHLRGVRPPDGDPASSSRPPWRGSTTCSSSTSSERGTRTPNIALLPRRARASCWSSSAATASRTPTTRPGGAWTMLKKQTATRRR